MPSDLAFQSATNRILERSWRLAECTDGETGLTRLFCSDAMRLAHGRVRRWMNDAGMTVRLDSAGNLIGRRPSKDSTKRALLVGSHLDTVVNAGRYDGTLGVLIGLGLAELCAEDDVALPMALDVVGFSEEEGVRYQTPYIGSRAVAGDLRTGDAMLERLDGEGLRMADCLARFGGDPEELNKAAYDPADVVAYLEPHIEQGPVLEEEGLALGVVTGVAGQTRASFRFTGEMGHAGTAPMGLRRDPLPAAARFVGEVQQAALRRPGMLATVGRMEVEPNIANVIPAEVIVRVDVRHAVDSERESCFVELHRAAMAAGSAAGIEASLEWCEHQTATPCDARCVDLIESCVAEEGQSPLRMTSGAGHDAVVMAQRFPAGLLFIRCTGGLSHHPDESVTEADVEAALRVLWRATIKLADGEREQAADRQASASGEASADRNPPKPRLLDPRDESSRPISDGRHA